jgi:hypothetical protein
MKKLLILVCALFALSATSFAQKKWQIGDIYDDDGTKGIVFAVTEDGAHGRILSFDQLIIGCSWDDAKQWCSELGEGWRLPTVQELHIILILGKDLDFNQALLFAGAQPIIWSELAGYWSGEEYYSEYAWRVIMAEGGDDLPFEKSNDCLARAVFAF